MPSVAETFAENSTPKTSTEGSAPEATVSTKDTVAPSTQPVANAPITDTPQTAPTVADTIDNDDAPEQDAKPLDWASLRDKYAKQDEKLMKRLSRYSSVESALDALVAAQNKISSGAIKAQLSDKATPEQVAEWREQNGIPASPDGYELEIPETADLTEDGKKFVDGFLSAAHKANLQPGAAQTLFNEILEQQSAEAEAKLQQEDANRQVAEEELRSEWGSEYRLNSNLINNLLDTAPQGVKEEIFGGRLADGTPIAHSTTVMRWLATLAREINPISTVVPGSGESAEKAVQSEMDSLKGMMGDPESPYNKGPNRYKLQARFEELVVAQQKHEKRK